MGETSHLVGSSSGVWNTWFRRRGVSTSGCCGMWLCRQEERLSESRRKVQRWRSEAGQGNVREARRMKRQRGSVTEKAEKCPVGLGQEAAP